ncbi:hypothetical protein J3E68DRAFT_346620 [Trichoderma sp. SZMC 28012]
MWPTSDRDPTTMVSENGIYHTLSLGICHFRSFPDRIGLTAKLSKRVVGFLFYYQQVQKPTSRAGPTKRQRHDSLPSSLSNGKRKLCCHLLMGHSSRTIRRRAERRGSRCKARALRWKTFTSQRSVTRARINGQRLLLSM